MKKFFLIGILLLRGSGGVANEFPVSNEEIIGKWRGYVLNRGEVTFMSPIVYEFLPSGIWSIQEEKHTAIPQGWYKIDRKILLLQPAQAALAKQGSAITGHWKSMTSFAIPNPMDQNTGLVFIKKDTVKKMSPGDVIGTWKIKQRNLYTDETKEATFLLSVNKDGTYHVEPKNSAAAEWAVGTWRISGEKMHLKNQYTGTGLWNEPSFFFLNGVLRYNNSRYCLWCERVRSEGE